MTDKTTDKFLNPLITKFKPFKKRIVGFDIETKGRKNKLVLASIVDEEFNTIVFSKEETFNYLNNLKLNKNVSYIATNLAFDFLGLVMEYKNYWKVSERKGHIYKFTWYPNANNHRTINFYDTLNYFKASVKDLGEIIKIPKMKHPRCFGKNPKNFNDVVELSEYCINDSLISQVFFKDFIIKYLNDNKLKLKTTIASISLEDFRRNYLKTCFKVEPHEDHKLVFNAYYGGRTEVFKRGTYKNVNCYDVNSLYPSQMIKEIPDPRSSHRVKLSNLHAIMKFEGVSYIEGIQPKTYIPLLPVRVNKNLKPVLERQSGLKLIFPTGKIKGYYTHIEIRKAIQEGFIIKKIGEGIHYYRTIDLFKEFVLDKYKIRQLQKAKGDPLELMTKLILNSLYGKFAFNYMENNAVINKDKATAKDIKNATFIEDLGNGFLAINSKSVDPVNYSFPIFSTYITAYARIVLYDFLKINEENLVYCDTDSIFLKDNNTIPESNKLGEMKHEYFKDKIIFVKPKMYASDYVKLKGCNTIKTEEDFLYLLDNPLLKIKEERFIKYRSVLRSKAHHKNGILNINQIIKVEKRLSLEDTKRVWKNQFDYKKQEDSNPISI